MCSLKPVILQCTNTVGGLNRRFYWVWHGGTAIQRGCAAGGATGLRERRCWRQPALFSPEAVAARSSASDKEEGDIRSDDKQSDEETIRATGGREEDEKLEGFAEENGG